MLHFLSVSSIYFYYKKKQKTKIKLFLYTQKNEVIKWQRTAVVFVHKIT